MSATNSMSKTMLISSAEILAVSAHGGEEEPISSLAAVESERWADAVDSLLQWYRAADAADRACLTSAIDFAVDQMENGVSPPSSIIVTEDDEVTFEWRAGKALVIVTIQDAGLAEYTRMYDCRVVEEAFLRRDPQTRKLQLESA